MCETRTISISLNVFIKYLKKCFHFLLSTLFNFTVLLILFENFLNECFQDFGYFLGGGAMWLFILDSRNLHTTYIN
jgi:hypothetical protein